MLAVVAILVPLLLALVLEKYLQPVLNSTLDRGYRVFQEAAGLHAEDLTLKRSRRSLNGSKECQVL